MAFDAPCPQNRLAGSSIQLDEILGAKIGQIIAFDVAPEVFDWIEFRRVGGQLLNLDPLTTGFDMGFDLLGPMRPEAIPYDEYRSLDVAAQMIHKTTDLVRFDRTLMQLKIHAAQRNAANA